ncbi:hypothetical protein [Streptomyces sp. BE133]|uniref:hypothetical protein n=1 Tax=Streptomyces sp. BE133 TaxID=3002523 RepID=UPI002E7A2A68|nr:hypothetical protein [Streptomyces sp. BE133]MEE1805238.1 hypothetical protein [Streptomyces sp. BE133]
MLRQAPGPRPATLLHGLFDALRRAGLQLIEQFLHERERELLAWSFGRNPFRSEHVAADTESAVHRTTGLLVAQMADRDAGQAPDADRTGRVVPGLHGADSLQSRR